MFYNTRLLRFRAAGARLDVENDYIHMRRFRAVSRIIYPLAVMGGFRAGKPAV